MATTDRLHLFGIRHHGPGCAQALVQALDELDPELVLIEGPPEAEPMLTYALKGGLVPPVALLLYDGKHPASSIFEPFAAYSPEWQALRWALRRGRPVRFIDLPARWTLAAMTARDEARKALEAAEEAADEASEPNAEDADEDESLLGEHDEDVHEPAPFTDAELAGWAIRRDPLGALAKVAGYDDGEAWWSELVEEETHASSLFGAIEAALTEVREASEAQLSQPRLELFIGSEEAHRERQREAHMRLMAAEGLKDVDGPVACVVGAWHVPALRRKVKKSDDRVLIKRAPRVDVQVTWVPWTNTRLARASGYRAGVAAPAWYEYLWGVARRGGASEADVSAGWAVRAAGILRERGELVSTAALIEVSRLAVTLASLRGARRPGVEMLDDALIATVCGGDAHRLRAVSEALYVGERVGTIGEATPQNPLQLDLARQCKSLRLKMTALEKDIRLDLRSKAGLAKSTLLHRLIMLDVPWGEPQHTGRSRGTFRENWTLAWRPEFSVALAEAMIYGTTVAAAAQGKALEATEKGSVGELAALVEACLIADLPDATDAAITRLQRAASGSADLVALMEAVPPLVSVLRYGQARKVPEEAIGRLVHSLLATITSGLHYSCRGLVDEPLSAMRGAVDQLDRSLPLLESDPATQSWESALGRVSGDADAAPALAGLAVRRLYDRNVLGSDETAAALSRALSPAAEPTRAAQWLEGFLAEAGQVLVFDDTLRGLIDGWLEALSGDLFMELLPMLRRAFAAVSVGERQLLISRLVQGTTGKTSRRTRREDPAGLARFDAAIPLLKTILGFEGAP